MRVIVNGKECDVSTDTVSYEEIVRLAGKQGHPTVVYRGPRKGDTQRSDAMYTGCATIPLDEGMVFNVMHTGNA